MNPPIAPIPVPPVPPKPVVPPEPISVKKLMLFVVVGLLFIGGITLAAWEEGRVGLFSSFGLKGYKRREADGLMVASKGKKPDYKEAFRLYQLDADKGDGVALRKIGEMYRDGRGVPQSDSKARESWIKAAAPGDVETLLWLADKYRAGDGRALPVNHPEGIRLLRRAASQGDAASQAKLARQLLTYVGEYQMKLDFDEVLSARQKEELLSLPKIAELLKANSDGSLEKMTSGQLGEKVAAAISELSDTLREKFNWEAYFWLSLSAASNDEADLRATRDGVGAKLKDKTLERVQGLVGKWSRSDAPGNAESPFTLDEGPVLDAPAVNKQTLSALLQEISAKAAKLPESLPEPVKPAAPKPAGSAAAPIPAPVSIPQKPASVSSVIAAMPVVSVDPAATKKYVDAMYEAQVGMAVRRNVLLTGPHNMNGKIANFGVLSTSYAGALGELKTCSLKLQVLRKDAKLVHPDVLAYSDRLGQFIMGRIAYMTDIQKTVYQVSLDVGQFNQYSQKYAAFKAFEERELGTLNALESMMTKRLGDELSIAVPDRNQLYTETLRAHERAVLDQLKAKSSSDIYALIVDGKWKLGDWTFEFGELRESRVSRPIASEGIVRVPYSLSAVDRNGVSRIFELNLYFTVTSKGTLRLIGMY
jgi:hypothetical protein